LRWAIGIIVGLFLASTPRAARGHTPGLSTASFEVAPNGRVEGQLAFATAEALSGIHLDGNHDHVVTPVEVKADGDELARFVLEGVDVSADGASCPPSYEGARIDEIDGLLLQAGFDCPADATRITATLYYLSRLPPAHREIARIAAGEATVQAVLSGDRRAVELALPAHAPRPRSRVARSVGWGAGALAALAAFYAAARLVARRRRGLTS
jgi:hypothetical protein